MPLAGSREPAQAMKTTVSGTLPSEGRLISPSGRARGRGQPLELQPVDDVRVLAVAVLGEEVAVPSTSKPVASTTAPTSTSTISSSWSKRMALVGQSFSQSLHLPVLKYVQCSRSMTGLLGTACGKGT